MTSPSASPRQVFHLSGKDSEAALEDFCQLLAENQAELLHLSQSMERGCLVITAELLAKDIPALIERARAFASQRDLHLEVIELQGAANVASACGVWVTVLGDLSSSVAISKVGKTLHSQGFIIRRVDTIGANDWRGVNILAKKSALRTQQFNSLRSALLALGPELAVDIAVQRDDVYRGSKRLLCMDVDSTFVKGEFIDELAELCNVKPQVAEITSRAMRGELDFEQALRERVALLKGLEMSKAMELCDKFELTPGAADLVTTVKQLGMRVGLVSGGFDFFVARLKKEFNLDFAFANELEVDAGVLTGKVIGTVVDSHRKAQVLKDMSHVFEIRLEQTIAAGDGANDIEMLQTAGLGIAYQAKPRLQEVADTRFNQNDRLDTLLYLMGYDAHKLFGDCLD